MKIASTGGNWDRNEWPVYFVAANCGTLKHAAPVHSHLLCAVNELHGEKDRDLVRGFIDAGSKVVLDSGVFALASHHAAANGITMDEALGLAPDEIDGFDELFADYVAIIGELGARAWGYIEIDQGGRENKIKTRARLEAIGLRPIPVYHPFNDGWDYFDYLAEHYDRICFGNVVQADQKTRRRLIATAWERRRKYPHLWIHALGMTPSDTTTAWPVNSCDSSTWISSVRWGQHPAWAANKSFGRLDAGFNYDPGSAPEDERGHHKAWRMCGYDAHMVSRCMGVMADDQRRSLECDIGMFK